MYIYSYYASDKTPLYVGSTGQVLQRFRQHQEEEPWMSKVASVSVKGPYSEKAALEFEKMYISKLQPVYNTNSLNFGECTDFCDSCEERYFFSIAEFEDYYSLQPETYHRGTYYLRLEDIEAIRMMRYFRNDDLSSIVRDALKIGLTELAKDIGHEDIYEEARNVIRAAPDRKRVKQRRAMI